MDTFFLELDGYRKQYAYRVPPQAETQALADELFYFLFPFLNPHPRPARIQFELMKNDLESLLHPVLETNAAGVQTIVDSFFAQLPTVRTLLLEDADAFFKFDPAATCTEEVIATYPGFHAIAVYRLAHALYQLDVPFLPRMMSEYLHGKTGIDIHPAASIGHSFFIDHGTGVVIGATAVIGKNVKIYQGVTLGALQVDKSLAATKRHPTIEDNTVIYANSTILGGKTVIGHDSVIGGNTWLTESVPPYSVVLHQAQVKVRTKPFEEPVNFVI